MQLFMVTTVLYKITIPCSPYNYPTEALRCGKQMTDFCLVVKSICYLVDKSGAFSGSYDRATLNIGTI